MCYSNERATVQPNHFENHISTEVWGIDGPIKECEIILGDNIESIAYSIDETLSFKQ